MVSARAEIRDAATVVLLRRGAGGTSVLMGRRRDDAAFMPGKFAFPGGAVDPGDGDIDLTCDAAAERRLSTPDGPAPRAFLAAAIRELWEETGLVLGRAAEWPDAPDDWRGFAATGHRPDAAALRFVFRAVTPPGRPRRFDARFFVAEATALSTDPDDFAAASGELEHLAWVPLTGTGALAMPFVSRLALAEAGADAPSPHGIAFLRDDAVTRIR